MAYVLFGFGSHTGSLGIRNTAVFGPENGLLGLGFKPALRMFALAPVAEARRKLIRLRFLVSFCLCFDHPRNPRTDFLSAEIYQVRRSG